MRGRPPKKVLTPEQERAALAFVDAAESPASGSGRADPPEAPVLPATPSPAAVPPAAASRAATRRQPRSDAPPGERPWEAEYVREDVVKGYALRLPEPLYLQLKWVAEQTGRSINIVCREAIEAEVGRYVTSLARPRRAVSRPTCRGARDRTEGDRASWGHADVRERPASAPQAAQLLRPGFVLGLWNPTSSRRSAVEPSPRPSPFPRERVA